MLTGARRARGSGRLRWITAWWVPLALCSLVSLGMFVSSPTMAAPDAEIHFGTAWFDVHHGFPRGPRVNHGVMIGPCYDERPFAPASCRTPLQAADVQRYSSIIINYPPPFYWLMGAGELAASVFSRGATGDGGRLASLVASLLLLLVAAWRLRRSRERSAIWALFLLATPMATFLWANGNPNGWEVACALFLAAMLLCTRESLRASATGGRELAWLLVACLLLSTSRPSGALEMCVIVGFFAVWSRLRWTPRNGLVLGLAVAPGLAFEVAWNRFYPFQVMQGRPFASAGLSEFISAMAASVQDVGAKAQGIWGALGWQDTFPSVLVFVALLVVLVTYLPTYAPSRSHRRTLTAIVAIVFAFSVLSEAAGWSVFPAWWQGRYSLPLLAGLSLFLFSDPTQPERPGLFALTAWVTVLNAYMVLVNFWRYDLGITNGFPKQVINPAYGHLHSGVVYGIVIVLLVTSGMLLVAERARDRTLRDAAPHVALANS